MEKRKLLIIGIIIIVFVMSVTVGLTYAFFTASVTGNDEAKETEITTAVLSVRFSDTNLINEINIMPGWSYEKTFTVENTGTGRAYYDILWDYVNNDFVNKNALTYSVTCTDGLSECAGMLETVMPNTSSNVIVLSKSYVEAGKTNTYTLRINYKETGLDQNSDQGKELSGKLMIRDAIAAIAFEGQLIDSNGNPLPNTKMELHSTPKTTITDANGYYRFNEVEIGNHTIYVKNSNDEIVASKEINIQAGQLQDSLKGTTLNVKSDATKVKAKIVNTNDIVFELATSYTVNINVQNGISTKNMIKTLEGYSDKVQIIPNEGYKLEGTTVTCDEGITKVFNDITGVLEITNINKNGNCNISAIKEGIPVMQKILEDNDEISDNTLDFYCNASGECYSSSSYTRSAQKGFYYTANAATYGEDGERIYYYRGKVDNNWVSFGGYYWRIVRTTAEGGVKLAYSGGDPVIGKSTLKTNTVLIGNIKYNDESTSSNVVKYPSSKMESSINAWYNGTKVNNGACCTDEYGRSCTDCDFTNLTDPLSNYENYLSQTAIYCNETQIYRTDSYKWGSIYNYIGMKRVSHDKPPHGKFSCNSSDRNTVVANASKGDNGYLTEPIAIITADEFSFSGRKGSYLDDYVLNDWWTMTPEWHYSTGTDSRVVDIWAGGLIDGNATVKGSCSARPVVALKSCVIVTNGDGSVDHPYELSDSKCN